MPIVVGFGSSGPDLFITSIRLADVRSHSIYPSRYIDDGQTPNTPQTTTLYDRAPRYTDNKCRREKKDIEILTIAAAMDSASHVEAHMKAETSLSENNYAAN